MLKQITFFAYDAIYGKFIKSFFNDFFVNTWKKKNLGYIINIVE